MNADRWANQKLTTWECQAPGLLQVGRRYAQNILLLSTTPFLDVGSIEEPESHSLPRLNCTEL